MLILPKDNSPLEFESRTCDTDVTMKGIDADKALHKRCPTVVVVKI